MMKNRDGYLRVPGGNIYWRAIGEGGKTPILTLHGGPGFAHGLLVKPFELLANDRTIVFYDQLGAGKSDRPQDLSLWRMERFIQEIPILREHLKLDEIILWGGSWGTMLGADYLLTNPPGVKAVIFSSPCLSAKKWKDDADRLRLKLPPDVQSTLLCHEQAGTTASEEYEKAMWEYLKRFACLLDPIPPAILDAFGDSNKEIYNYMWGPSEFHPTGTLKDYDRTPDLGRISQPSLYLCGREDEATPESTQYYSSLTPNAEFKVVERASHLAILEQPEAYMRVMREFLNKIDKT